MAAAKQALAGQSVFDALLALPGLPEWQTDKIAAEKKGFARLKTMAPGPGIRLILDGNFPPGPRWRRRRKGGRCLPRTCACFLSGRPGPAGNSNLSR